MEMIEVFLVDKEPLWREGFRASLPEGAGIKLIGEADGTEEDLVSVIEAYSPDVVLVDIDLPSLRGLHLVRHLGQRLPEVSVIVLTSYEEDNQLFQTVKAGAQAYVTKNIPSQSLVGVIKTVRRGEYPINETLLTKPDLASRILSQFQSLVLAGQDMQVLVAPLSPREIEILNLVANGCANKQIAHSLKISEQTVKNHMTSILRKLAANDRTHAVVLALRHGLISV